MTTYEPLSIGETFDRAVKLVVQAIDYRNRSTGADLGAILEARAQA